MRKKRYIAFIILAIFILGMVFYPYVDLAILRHQQKMTDDKYYSSTYEKSREKFLANVDALKSSWGNVNVKKYTVDEKQGLYTDIIELDAAKDKENLIIFTAGVHGIEGYVGAAMIQKFIDENLKNIDKNNTGVYFVQGVNPWGMKNYRRYNEDNVDINRNFIQDWSSLDKNYNKDYTDLKSFLAPEKKVGNMTLTDASFYGKLAVNLIKKGSTKIENATVNGQFEQQTGIYYGGSEDEISTKNMKEYLQECADKGYKNIIHIDLHSGYGPKYTMSIFNSAKDPMKHDEAVAKYNYPTIITPDSKDFYATKGDICEYFYDITSNKYNNDDFYSTCFEFGTYGSSTVGSVRSLQSTVYENMLYHNGTSSNTSRSIVDLRYEKMFVPSEKKWQDKAFQDFEAAAKGVLKARLKY